MTECMEDAILNADDEELDFEDYNLNKEQEDELLGKYFDEDEDVGEEEPDANEPEDHRINKEEREGEDSLEHENDEEDDVLSLGVNEPEEDFRLDDSLVDKDDTIDEDRGHRQHNKFISERTSNTKESLANSYKSNSTGYNNNNKTTGNSNSYSNSYNSGRQVQNQQPRVNQQQIRATGPAKYQQGRNNFNQGNSFRPRGGGGNNPRQNFHHFNNTRPEWNNPVKKRNIFINPKYQGSVQVANNARLAYDDSRYQQPQQQQQPIQTWTRPNPHPNPEIFNQRGMGSSTRIPQNFPPQNVQQQPLNNIFLPQTGNSFIPPPQQQQQQIFENKSFGFQPPPGIPQEYPQNPPQRNRPWSETTYNNPPYQVQPFNAPEPFMPPTHIPPPTIAQPTYSYNNPPPRQQNPNLTNVQAPKTQNYYNNFNSGTNNNNNYPGGNNQNYKNNNYRQMEGGYNDVTDSSYKHANNGTGSSIVSQPQPQPLPQNQYNTSKPPTKFINSSGGVNVNNSVKVFNKARLGPGVVSNAVRANSNTVSVKPNLSDFDLRKSLARKEQQRPVVTSNSGNNVRTSPKRPTLKKVVTNSTAKPFTDVSPPKRARLSENLVTVNTAVTVKNEPQQPDPLEEDEETAYLRKIEEQKRERERILRQKEERRLKKLAEQTNSSTPPIVIRKEHIDIPPLLKQVRTPPIIQQQQQQQQQKQLPIVRPPPQQKIRPVYHEQNNQIPVSVTPRNDSYPEPVLSLTVKNDRFVHPNPYAQPVGATSGFMSNRVIAVKNPPGKSSVNLSNLRVVRNDFDFDSVNCNNNNVSDDDSEFGSGRGGAFSGGGSLSSFLSNRTVLAKEPTLRDTRLVVVGNLSTATTQGRLAEMARGIGEVQQIRLDKAKREASILFKSVASAHAFFKKYQRFMLDLSIIEVRLESMI